MKVHLSAKRIPLIDLTLPQFCVCIDFIIDYCHCDFCVWGMYSCGWIHCKSTVLLHIFNQDELHLCIKDSGIILSNLTSYIKVNKRLDTTRASQQFLASLGLFFWKRESYNLIEVKMSERWIKNWCYCGKNLLFTDWKRQTNSNTNEFFLS